MAIPLRFDRPAPGMSVTIPAPFLAYESLTGPGLALLYDPNQNEWVSARANPARTLLRFQLPAELLPLRIERAILEVDVNVPSRSFEIFAGGGARPEVLAARRSPVGRFRFVIERPDLLQPDAEGGVRLGLSVGEGGPSTEWKINDVQLELSAAIQP